MYYTEFLTASNGHRNRYDDNHQYKCDLLLLLVIQIEKIGEENGRIQRETRYISYYDRIAYTKEEIGREWQWASE